MQISLAGGGRRLIEKAPIAWQEKGGRRTPVNVGYECGIDGRISFALGNYDRAYPLIIDPTLIYSTYLGGSADDAIYKIAVDKSRNIYIAGLTTSTDFPTPNPLQPVKSTGYDGFVVKLSPNGSQLIYATYLGGGGGINDNDLLMSLAIDAEGSAYVTGNTYSTTYPTVNAFQSQHGGGSDTFLSKLDPSGSTLSTRPISAEEISITDLTSPSIVRATPT